MEGLPDVLGTPEPKRTQPFSGNHLPFIGFSYSRHIPLIINDSLTAAPDVAKRVAFLEREVQITTAEKNRLEAALQNAQVGGVVVAKHTKEDSESHSERDTSGKQIETLKAALREKETRLNELELFKKTADKNLEEFRARLEQERTQSFDATASRKKLEDTLSAYDLFFYFFLFLLFSVARYLPCV